MQRIVMLVDLDSFYASVEELRKPEIRGKPVVVCMYSGRTEDSGAVATANYPARELGIRSGMWIREAKSKAKGHDVVFLPADREYYREVSGRVMEILQSFADSFEQVSVDEAYIDATERTGGSYARAEKIAGEIKDAIKEREKITCSVGVGPNKVIAKMASSVRKPDGLTVIRPDEVKKFLGNMPVKKLPGIGGKTEDLLKKMGIETISQLAGLPEERLSPYLGPNLSLKLLKRARGEDDEPVREEERKQLSRWFTLKKDSSDFSELEKYIEPLAVAVAERAGKLGFSFRTVSVMVVIRGIQIKTRSRTLEESASGADAVISVAKALLKGYLEENQEKIRRFGIALSSFREKQKGLAHFVSK